MYKLGNLSEFIADEVEVKKSTGWTKEEIVNGKIITEDDEGETIHTVVTDLLPKRQNPDGSNEYLWESANGDIKDPFNILAIWTKNIKVDATRCTKYVIYNNEGEYTCTKVDPNSCINFGFKVADIEIFDTEKDCHSRAKELGIEIEDF